MNLLLFLPETILLIFLTLLLCLTLLKKELTEKMLMPFVGSFAFVLLAAAFCSLRVSGDLFYSTYRIDLLSQGFKILLSLVFFFIFLLSGESVSIQKERRLEYFFFLSTATLGMMMITSSVNILTLYISLELSAYSLYLLSAFKQGRRDAEASVKYLIFGAATSGFFLWGFSLIAGLAGTTNLLEISKNVPVLITQPAFSLGLVFASFSFLFKLSGFPVHFWAPDVYESSATPVTAFIATASKAAAVAILIRILMLMGLTHAFVIILGTMAFISMTLGNTVALVQQDVKRLLAYSSIAQAGYILVGLLAGSFDGYTSCLFYALAYVLMNAGAFMVTVLVAKASDHDNPQMAHFDGLADRSPFLALILLLSLLSLAGIPPLVGFTGKWILFSSAMDKGHWFLVLSGVLNSVVSLFYYLTIVKHAYLEKPKTNTPLVLSMPMKLLGLFLFCAIVFLGIFPNYFITFAQTAIQQLGAF